MAQTQILAMCAQWHWLFRYDGFWLCAQWLWPLRYDLGLRSWHILWVMDNYCVKYYPDPTWQGGVMAQTQILDTSALWPWPWNNDLWSRSWHTFWSWTLIVWNIGSGELWMWILVVCTVTLTFEILPWFKVMTHPLVMDNEILSRSDKVVRSYGLDKMWTDGQTVWFLYTPPNVVFGDGEG